MLLTSLHVKRIFKQVLNGPYPKILSNLQLRFALHFGSDANSIRNLCGPAGVRVYVCMCVCVYVCMYVCYG